VLPDRANLCADKLSSFMRHGWPHVDPSIFVSGWHLGLIAEWLEALLAGEIQRAIFNVPPGHCKSLEVSVFFPAWVWIKHPEKRFVATSYRGDLALRDADRSRELMRSAWYQDAWGSRFYVRSDQDTKSRFTNNYGGYRFSTATSGIMGEGGDYIVFDDPHNVEQAESDDVREDAVRKIRLALPTRVRAPEGEGGIVAIMQRLHTRDFAGRMIAEDGGWYHLCLPARFEKGHPFVSVPVKLKSGKTLPGDPRTVEGEPLWPELFPDSRITSLEDALGPYGAAGQLRQYPVAREGGLFKRAWFASQIIDAADVPEGGARPVRGYDLAGSKTNRSPYSASVKIQRIVRPEWRTPRYFVLHASRIRGTPHEVESWIVAMAATDGHGVEIDFPQDPGQAGKAQVQSLKGLVDGYVVRSSPESGSKVARAEPFSSQCEGGNAYLVQGAWNDPYLDELCLFPFGDYADFTDATSRAYHRARKRDTQTVGLGAEVIG